MIGTNVVLCNCFLFSIQKQNGSVSAARTHIEVAQKRILVAFCILHLVTLKDDKYLFIRIKE